MTTTVTTLAPVELLELFDSLEIVCDFAHDTGCDQPAQWLMHRAVHGCGFHPPALACTDCKDDRLSGEWALECRWCDYVTAPARAFYSYIEELRKS